jgi:peptidoglycan/xylan/chitin deacetylase (PgdA/CDA1 family)
MRGNIRKQPANGSGGASTALLERDPAGTSKRWRVRRYWKLLTAMVATALFSSIIAVYLLPSDVSAWDPLGSSQWLGAFQLNGPGAMPTATLPSDYGVTPFPSPTPTNAAVAVAGRRNVQACGRYGAAPSIHSSLIASAQGAYGIKGEVALTFDDGPGPVYTQQIINILRAWNAPATFFVVGVHAQRYPSLVQEEAADGFAVGNHTLDHLDLTKLSPTGVSDAISSAAGILRSVTGNNCLWLFRPPYGHYDPTVISTAQSQGFISMLWDVDGLDWTRPGPTFIANRIAAGLHSGAIILMHDSAPDWEVQDRSQTVAALPMVLAAIRSRGLRPVTLPTLLSDAGYITLNP